MSLLKTKKLIALKRHHVFDNHGFHPLHLVSVRTIEPTTATPPTELLSFENGSDMAVIIFPELEQSATFLIGLFVKDFNELPIKNDLVTRMNSTIAI